ncbi:MAG: GIY-YIG nuclease family protein [Patescibacteria group bacterium]
MTTYFEKIPCVYILASKKNGTLYTGVTSNLQKRVNEHKEGMIGGFTKKYLVHTLVYYEVGDSMEGAIMREKQIKAGSRKNKVKLIEQENIEWRDLYAEL